MSVYVDDAAIPYRRMKMCHLVADTLDELHAMAERLDLRRWFQGHASFPHYDVCLSKRDQAIALGAKPITSKQLVLFMRRKRGQEIPEYLRDVELPA